MIIETWLHQDINEPVKVNYLNGNLFTNNGNGNRINVLLTSNGEAVSISGTVSGYVVTADGSTVPCTGSKSGNRASILIPAAAYQPGPIFITVFVTDGTQVTTIGAVSSTVLSSRTNAQVDPGSVVTDWTQTINAAMQAVQTAAANMSGIIAVPYASITFPVPLGKYTVYNDNLYRCITPIASSESFTAAHWTQVRLGDDVSALKSALAQYNSYSFNRVSGTGTWWTNWVNINIKSGSKVKVTLTEYGGSYLTNFIFRLYNGDTAVTSDEYVPAQIGGTKEITAPGDATKVRIQFVTSQDDGALVAKVLLRTDSEYGIAKDILELQGTSASHGTRLTALEENETDVDNQIDSIKANMSQFAYQNIEKETITTKNGLYDETGFHSSSGFTCAEYNCTAGNAILVTCSGNNDYVGYYFYDTNGTMVTKATAGKSYQDALVIVPVGAVKLGLNKLGNSDFTIKAINVSKPVDDNPFVVTDLLNDDSAGRKWVQLVEIDNLSGVYTSVSNFAKNGTSITGYVTKVYDVSNISKARFSGNAYGLIGEKADGTKVSLSSLFSMPATETIFDVTEYVKVYIGATQDKFWGGWSTNFIKLEGYTKIDSKWNNRKIVWFGTSIPAGGFKGSDQPLSYPYQVGRLLGATVYNEAVGDSGVHYRELSKVSATNPYGFNFYFVSATRCLTNTIAMMQWLGNWADYYCNGGTYKNPEEWDATIFTSGLPSSWTDVDTEAIKQFSYENKLDKYLTDSTFPDLFVFDHGYNDRIRWADATGTYEAQLAEYGRDNCYTFRGAMNFLIDRIYSFNPRAKIIMIGDYENQSDEKKYDSTYQMRVAEDYEIPIYKRWEYTGWSQVQETAHYTWSSGLLNYTKNSTATKTLLAWALPDGVHPHSDKTGGAIRRMARLIAPFINKLE